MSNLSNTQKMVFAGLIALVSLLTLQFFVVSWTVYAVFGAFAVLTATLTRFCSVRNTVGFIGWTVVMALILAIAGGESFINRFFVGRSADMLGGLTGPFLQRLVPAVMIAESLVLTCFVIALIVMAIKTVVKKCRAKSS